MYEYEEREGERESGRRRQRKERQTTHIISLIAIIIEITKASVLCQTQ